MKMAVFLCGAIVLALTSCKKNKPSFPDVPQIYYLSTTPDTMLVTNPNQSIKIEFRFTDGGGDIALGKTTGDSTIFLKDSRDTDSRAYTYAYPMPYIPASSRDGKGLEGVITLNLTNAYFSPRDSLHLALGKDTMYWSIFIRDTSGNKSNVIKTDPIYLRYR